MFRELFRTVVFGLAVLAAGCTMHVNRNIRVPDGTRSGSDQMTINGNIDVGDHCELRGSCRTVNGEIRIGRESHVRGLQTVNGGILIGAASGVHGNVESVNGPVSCESGVKVAGRIRTVNGGMDLVGTVVQKGLDTYNGSISLSDSSVVKGDVVVRKSKGSGHARRGLSIRVLDGSVIEGDIRVLDPDLSVDVFLHSGGKVKGHIINARTADSGTK